MGILLLSSFAVAVIYFVINQKNVYGFTNKVIGDELDELGCPTQRGILIHAILGGILFYIFSYLFKK